jgi:hypothetical protein
MVRELLDVASLSEQLLFSLIDVPCPRCHYPFEVQLVDVIAQVYRWCPVCRARIKLIDSAGSGAASLSNLDTQMNRLHDILRGLQ